MPSESDVYKPPQRPETDAEAALHAWWTDQRTKSVDNLEAAARQMITLGSALLTALLGLMALSNATLPAHMTWSGIQWLSGLGIVGLFAALAFALVVVYPRPNPVTRNDPAAEKQAFEGLLQRKSRWLSAALWAFGVGMACIVVIVLISLALLV
jgi:hypothetical protein